MEDEATKIITKSTRTSIIPFCWRRDEGEGKMGVVFWCMDPLTGYQEVSIQYYHPTKM